MNREIKRRMKREERAAEKSQQRGRAPVPVTQQKRRDRVKIRQFFREIQAELKRVVWPTFPEVVTYSVVVIVVVALLTGIVFVLDFGFAQSIVRLFEPAGGP